MAYSFHFKAKDRLKYFPASCFMTITGLSAAALAFLLTLALLLTAPATPASAQAPITIKIGLLPIFDTIILHTAQRQGYFAARGLDVELIPFQSAQEKDAAVVAGALDGHFGEIGSVIMQRSLDLPFIVAATTSHTDKNRRNFALVTKPDPEFKTMQDHQGKSVAISKLYIVDFLTSQFLKSNSYPDDFLKREDIKKIPLRFQMLLSGQIDTALLPEPLATLAEKAGGLVLLDDTNLDMPLAVVALKDSLGDEVFCKFQASLAQAVEYINQNPAPTKELMLELGLVMGELREQYQAPSFDPSKIPYSLPTREVFDAYVDWLVKSGVMTKSEEKVDGLLKAPLFEDVVLQSLTCR